MPSGIMPTVGVPSGDSRVVGGVSVAPTVTPATGCDVQYYKTACTPPNDRQQWNWLIANLIAAQNDCGLNYDCTSADQLRELICCLARKCAMLCRSTVTPAPTAWPPVAYNGPFVVDDTAVPPVLYFWDCNSNVYVPVPTSSGAFDICADVPVDTEDPTEPVYGLQCISGVARRVPVTSSAGVTLRHDEFWHKHAGSLGVFVVGNPAVPMPAAYTASNFRDAAMGPPQTGSLNPAFGLPAIIQSITESTLGLGTNLIVAFSTPMPNINYHIYFSGHDAMGTVVEMGTVSAKTLNGFTVQLLGTVDTFHSNPTIRVVSYA